MLPNAAQGSNWRSIPLVHPYGTFEDNNRFPRLHEKRFVLFEILERLEDRVKRFPGTRGFPAPAIDHEILWLLCHLRIEIILDHAIRGFAQPVSAGAIHSSRARTVLGPDMMQSP